MKIGGKSMKRSAIALLAIVSLFNITAPAFADCDPKDFTIQDVQRLNFSDDVKYSAYSVLNQDTTQQNNTNVSGGAVIYGVPVNLSYSDAKSLSDHILSVSGIDASRDTRLNYVRTALSSVGAEMYANCLATRIIKVTIPSTAYSQKIFNLNVTWTRQDDRLPNRAPYTIRIVGGTIESQSRELTGSLTSGSPRPFRVEKQSGPLEIDIIVDRSAYPPIVIPPVEKVKHFNVVKRTGIGPRGRPQGVGDVCTDHAYLVDEVGSGAGAGQKYCKLCVDRSPEGFLLSSTATTDPSASSAPHGTQIQIETYAPGGQQMCATFKTNGAGQDSGRFEIHYGVFNVWEAIPAP
jgi:hypothetical protein